MAGGKSSRMGQNKALLKFGGQTLLARTLAVLDGVFEEVLISSNDSSLYHDFGYPVITDNIPDKGPLGGLQAVLKASPYERVFLAACDMPFISEKAIRYLAGQKNGYEITVPYAQGRIHPLFAFYRRSILSRVDNCLKYERLKIAGLIADCDSHIVRVNGDLEEKIFINVNTPQELESVRKRYLNN